MKSINIKSILIGVVFAIMLLIFALIESWYVAEFERINHRQSPEPCEYITSIGDDMHIYADKIGGAFWRSTKK